MWSAFWYLQGVTCVAFPSVWDAQRLWLSEQVSALFCHCVCFCVCVCARVRACTPLFLRNSLCYLSSRWTKVRGVRECKYKRCVFSVCVCVCIFAEGITCIACYPQDRQRLGVSGSASVSTASFQFVCSLSCTLPRTRAAPSPLTITCVTYTSYLTLEHLSN